MKKQPLSAFVNSTIQDKVEKKSSQIMKLLKGMTVEEAKRTLFYTLNEGLGGLKV